MPTQINAAPSVADMLLFADQIGKELKNGYALLGRNIPGETGTLASVGAGIRNTLLGDGGSLYGLTNPGFKAAIKDALNGLPLSMRYDGQIRRALRDVMFQADSWVASTLPDGWTFISNASNMQHALDAWLLRQNACHSGVPTTPAAAGVLTAISNANGAMPTTTAGNAPRIYHTLVGANDYDESLPSAEATQVALASNANGYSYQIAGTVPTGTTKVRIYSSYYAALTGDPKGWLKDATVIAGAAYPAILILEPSAALRMDWLAPSWLSCLLLPETAASFALANSTVLSTGNADSLPIKMTAAGMLTAQNIVLNPSNAYLGVGNVPQHGIFGSRILGSAYGIAGILGANSPDRTAQGFAGATKLRARVKTVLNGTLTLTVTYSCYKAANGYGNTQTVSGASATMSGTAVDSVAVFSIPAGSLIIGNNETGTSGTATTGEYVYEADPDRTI